MQADKVFYYDHNGELQFTFNDYNSGLYVGLDSDLCDWELSWQDQYGHKGNFYRSKDSFTLPVVLPTDDTHVRDNLVEIFTEDALAGEPGTLMLRGWELPCYITQSKHSWVGHLDRIITFTVTPTYPVWERRTTKHFNGITGGGGGSTEDLGRDYTKDAGATVPARGYNYGYSVSQGPGGFFDVATEGNGYELLVFGPLAGGFTIYANNKPITVARALQEGEYIRLVSNGGTKTIDVVNGAGEVIANAFNDRDKNDSPFLVLPKYTEITFGQVEFDFTLIERRSEPTWN